MTARRTSEQLRDIPLFERCSKSELQTIARVVDEVSLPAGRVLMAEGDRGRELFLLVSGEVDVRRKGRKIATLGPGAMVGEMALVSNTPRRATVTTLTPVAALVIADHDFRGILKQNPGLQAKVLQSLADRLAAVID